MVTLTASGGNALDMDRYNWDRLTDTDAVIVQMSSSSLVIDVEGLRFSFSGSGVRYNGFGEPTGGTITALTISSGGNSLFQVSGFAVSAPTFYLATYAPDSPFPLIFAGNDDIRGSTLNDAFRGYGGHDILQGGDGGDYIVGGDGNDHIYGQSPTGGSDAADVLYGNDGNDYIQGNAGDDQIIAGEGSDRIQGGQGNDIIYCEGGNDVANGNLGDDNLQGAFGNDLLRGGKGDDFILGGPGNDTISGDLGADLMEGGDGIDLFLLAPGTSLFGNNLDAIQGFEHGIDRLAIGFIPATVMVGNTTYTSNDAARSAAQALFDGHAGSAEVAAMQIEGGASLLFWSSIAGGTIDSAVRFDSLPAGFNTSDFVV